MTESQQVAAIYLAGHGLKETSKISGVSIRVVRGILKQKKITRTTGRPGGLPRNIQQIVVQEYVSGESSHSLAKRFDTYPTTIIRYVKLWEQKVRTYKEAAKQRRI